MCPTCDRWTAPPPVSSVIRHEKSSVSVVESSARISVVSLLCEALLERIEKVLLGDPGALFHRDHAVDDGVAVAVGMEVLQAGLNGLHARAQDEIGVNGDLESHLRQCGGRHDRCAAALDDVGDLDAGKGTADLG